MRTDHLEAPVPSVPSIPRLRAMFHTAHPTRAADAIQRVVASGPAAIPALRALQGHPDDHVALHAGQALALLGDDDAFRLIVEHFLDYRGTGEWAARQGWRGAFALMTHVGYFDDWPRVTVLAVLAPYVAEHEERLLRLVEADLGEASLYAVRLLGRHGSADATRTLMTLLEDRSANVDLRWCAAEALGDGGQTGAIELLGQRLLDEEESDLVRVNCIRSLHRFGSSRAIELLHRACAANDESVRADAIWWMERTAA